MHDELLEYGDGISYLSVELVSCFFPQDASEHLQFTHKQTWFTINRNKIVVMWLATRCAFPCLNKIPSICSVTKILLQETDQKENMNKEEEVGNENNNNNEELQKEDIETTHNVITTVETKSVRVEVSILYYCDALGVIKTVFPEVQAE